jgi:hypothetical protein
MDPVAASLIVTSLVASVLIFLLIDVLRNRFEISTYRSFSYFGAAFNTMLLSFTIFFLTEALEIFGPPREIESLLNNISVTLILVSQAAIFILIWRVR